MSRFAKKTAADANAGEPHIVTVYSYGLLDPLDWAVDCEDELRRMTALWNNLVEKDHAYRAGVMALTAGDPAVMAAEAAKAALVERLAAARAARAALRQQARKKVKTPALDAEIKCLTADRKIATAASAP